MKILLSILVLAFTNNVLAADDLISLEKQAKELFNSGKSVYVNACAHHMYSTDPLEGTNMRNSRIFKLIHATPIERTLTGAFDSILLDSFAYSDSKQTLTLKIKSDATYSDGSIVTAEDLVLAIKRNILRRPTFPAINDIEGKESWLKKEHPLKSNLEGLKSNKNIISILFNKDQRKIFDGFTSSNFGVVPAKCVDLETNNITCSELPTAGRYKIDMANKLNGKSLFFPTFIKTELRPQFDRNIYSSEIWVVSTSPSRIIKYVDSFKNVVIVANDVDIPVAQKKTLLSSMRYLFSPKVKYGFLQLNPESKSFSNKRARQLFAMVYRETMMEKGLDPEGSQMTNIMLGYLPLNALNATVEPFSKQERLTIIDHLRKHPPVWIRTAMSHFDPFVSVFSATMEKLKIKEQPLGKEFISPEDHNKGWDDGSISVRIGTSTLGPDNPTRDLQTFYTYGLHTFLNYLTADPHIQKLVSNLDPNDLKSHVDLNKYVFNDARLSVVSNYSRIYIFPSSNTKLLPVRLTEPDTWMYFVK